jgi:hypothetical protein
MQKKGKEGLLAAGQGDRPNKPVKIMAGTNKGS